MRLSVELDELLVKEVMKMTGETKMSSAIAKAAELFVRRKKAVALLRSLREQPLDYPWTNDQIESWGEGDTKTPSGKNRPVKVSKTSSKKK